MILVAEICILVGLLEVRPSFPYDWLGAMGFFNEGGREGGRKC